MTIICMFFPAIILCSIRRHLFGNEHKSLFDDMKHFIVEYVVSCIAINLLIWCGLAVLRHHQISIYDSIAESNLFAIKYLLISILFAIAEPYAEKYVKERIIFTFDVGGKSPAVSKRYQRVAVYGFALLMFLLHFIRIFDNSFWGDEGIAINAAHMTWSGMLKYVAMCGHSPFHYAFLWGSCKLFGYSGIIYHFVSLLPYLIILIVTLTVVWKWFGVETTVILITLSSLLQHAVTYNVEVRMYSWCQLFIFLAYLIFFQLFKTGKKRYYLYITIFSLGAVYCHYYALASIGILYFALLIYCIKVRFQDIWKVFLSGISVIVGFVPWLLYCFETKGQVMLDYGIQEVTWRSCFEYIFSSRYSMLLLAIFFITLVLALSKELGLIQIEKTSDGKKHIHLACKIRKNMLSADLIWMTAGICAVLGTIVASKIISSLVYPILVLRYLYPSFIIMWLLLGINVSKCYLKKMISALLIIIIIVSCVPAYYDTLKYEQTCDKILQSTLEATCEIDDNDYITTDINHLNWTVSQVYYPDTPRRLFVDSQLPTMDLGVNNWLFLEKPISDEIIQQLEEQNCIAEKVVERGYIGTGDVWIYKILEMTE